MSDDQSVWTVYGASGSGSVAVEAALHLAGVPYTIIEAETWADAAARERVAPVNPQRQVPTLVLPGGEVMTESAAILIAVADRHPESGLAPEPGDPARGQFLRWMLFVSSAIYSLYWILADVHRIGVTADEENRVAAALHERIASCWRTMDRQIMPERYCLGDRLGVLDLYVAVVSRFRPGRRRFAEAAPQLAAVAKRVDQDPRLQEFWPQRYAFEKGWER